MGHIIIDLPGQSVQNMGKSPFGPGIGKRRKKMHPKYAGSSRHSYPWDKMLPREVSRRLTSGQRKAEKKLHNRKARYCQATIARMEEGQNG